MSSARHLFQFGLFVAFLGVVSPVFAAPPDLPKASATKDTKRVYCNDAMFRFLPGEYNFCLAGVDMSRGHYRSAIEMLDLAAGWGSKKAQYVLGLTYFRGDSIPADRPLGLAWLALAAERHDPEYLAVYVSARGKSTPVEMQRARELLATMVPVYADAVAARRAQKRFDRMMHELTYYEPFDVGICIKGLTGGLVTEEQFTDSSCPSPRFAAARLHLISDVYFDGWAGHVSVGALETILPRNKPAAAVKVEAQ